MNKFIDFQEASQPIFRNIFRELEYLYLMSQGRMLKYHYKYIQTNFHLYPSTRRWEYPWAIINSKVKKGDRVLDAGCGGSPLLPYLYKIGCLCYGLDNKFYDEIMPLSSYTIKHRVAQRLSKVYPLYFWFNPHGQDGLSNLNRPLEFKINYLKVNLVNLPFADNTFERIFCISVIEHISRENMFKVASEFNRILKPQGLLVVTIDCWETGLLWQDFIKASNLKLYGEYDFTLPPKGKYIRDVIGFILKKYEDT